MSEKLFVLATDTEGHLVHLNVHQISSVKTTTSGAIITTADGEKIHLAPGEFEKLSPFVAALTHKREPLITK